MTLTETQLDALRDLSTELRTEAAEDRVAAKDYRGTALAAELFDRARIREEAARRIEEILQAKEGE